MSQTMGFQSRWPVLGLQPQAPLLLLTLAIQYLLALKRKEMHYNSGYASLTQEGEGTGGWEEAEERESGSLLGCNPSPTPPLQRSKTKHFI